MTKTNLPKGKMARRRFIRKRPKVTNRATVQKGRE